MENWRSQGYDNGSNMRAFATNSLNFVINKMGKASLETANIFLLLSECCTYFASWNFWWATLREHLDNLTLKPLGKVV